MRRAQRFLLDSGSETRTRRARFRQLASRYDAIVDEIVALPVAFVHGEFYASNILVEFRSGDVCVRPLDWELAGIGCPLMDLAALTAGWTDLRRSELAFTYHAEVSPQAPTWLPPDAFMRALDCCRVQLAVQCLGWASRWMPPQPHAHDWLNEALQAAERIGL
jgi:aminoglycoside/choline kinase family phosphotransferase